MRSGITEDITRIRESVHVMISEAISKRQRAAGGKKGETSSDGESKAPQSEKMEKLLKTLEENYKRELVEL